MVAYESKGKVYLGDSKSGRRVTKTLHETLFAGKPENTSQSREQVRTELMQETIAMF